MLAQEGQGTGKRNEYFGEGAFFMKKTIVLLLLMTLTVAYAMPAAAAPDPTQQSVLNTD